MEEKYILTSETTEINKHTLHRIKALKDFGDVKKGDLGGWVEDIHNLSHRGNCWVYDDAAVYSEAKVMDNAKVFDDAKITNHSSVKGDAEVHGSVWVDEYSIVQGHAKVTGKYRGVMTLRKALIEDYAEVLGDAFISMHICGNAKVDCWCCSLSGSLISGNARLKGSINIKNYVSIWDSAILGCKVMHLDGDISIEGNARIQGDSIGIVGATNNKIEIDGDAMIQGNFNICGNLTGIHINSYTILKNHGKSKLNIKQ